ncbi:Zinc/iron permease [Auriculariales sp. MPI-PUGE-AT-0066]|nr:Zinc/iron permease [Auriculariales sp. MPI-PUGE-AT-0066]
MAGSTTVLIMALLMGVASFGFGILPLSFPFSKTRLAQLSTFGVGLLLGASLGVVIPEGVQSVTPRNGALPTHKIALSLIGGFAVMLLIEQLLPGHAHVAAAAQEVPKPSSAPGHTRRYSVAASTASDNELDLDHEIELLESNTGGGSSARDTQAAASRARALPLSMGLVIHCMADGLALGASAIPVSGGAKEQAEAAALPLIVFLALVIHKAPTALALCTSLLAAGLPKPAVRKHLTIFSLSSPLSAIFTYYFLTWFGSNAGSWTGVALLASGGSFLYVATVLQPVSPHSGAHSSSAAEELSKFMRLTLVIAGMLTPIFVTSLVGHDEHTHPNGPPADWPKPIGSTQSSARLF